MTIVNPELQQIRTARASLEKFRLKLLCPSISALEGGAADLGVAVKCLQRIEPALASPNRRSPNLERILRIEVAGLRRDLQLVTALFKAAGSFYQGWSRLMGSASDEGNTTYMANGKQGAPVLVPSKNPVMHG
jgi:hypothetical protein